MQSADLYALDLLDVLEWRKMKGSGEKELFRSSFQYPTGGGMIPIEDSRLAVLHQKVDAIKLSYFVLY